jgi:DNA-binding NarL/FixJ family response regulator
LEALKSREAQRRLQSNLEDVTQHTLDVLLKRVNVIYESEEKDKLQRIMAEFEATYPKTLDKLKSAYPNLNESECIVAALNFMGFRIKEEAALLNLSENTVMKYRSNLKKLVDFDPISALLDQEKSVIELI